MEKTVTLLKTKTRISPMDETTIVKKNALVTPVKAGNSPDRAAD
jgi:hypothetical protein